jgi:hypothetical protein
MLAGQQEITSSLAEIKDGIGPGVEVRATSESETCIVGGVFASVVDEGDSEMESSGEFAQGGKDGRNFGCVVFVHALESHIGVQYQKAGAVPSEGLAKA